MSRSSLCLSHYKSVADISGLHRRQVTRPPRLLWPEQDRFGDRLATSSFVTRQSHPALSSTATSKSRRHQRLDCDRPSLWPEEASSRRRRQREGPEQGLQQGQADESTQEGEGQLDHDTRDQGDLGWRLEAQDEEAEDERRRWRGRRGLDEEEEGEDGDEAQIRSGRARG